MAQVSGHQKECEERRVVHSRGRMPPGCRVVPVWIPTVGFRELHHPFILQRMFVHATESGWKEVESLICCHCWGGHPRLDPKADVSAIQLVGFQTSREEIRELFHQVFMLKRLPRPLPCGPKWAQDIPRDILSSLKDCLWQRRGDSLEGSIGLEPSSACLSHSQNRTSWRERQGMFGKHELAEAKEAHQWALAAASILEERIETQLIKY